ncbi:hypothetical protein ACJX0J_021114, partial [Zea mays]
WIQPNGYKMAYFASAHAACVPLLHVGVFYSCAFFDVDWTRDIYDKRSTDGFAAHFGSSSSEKFMWCDNIGANVLFSIRLLEKSKESVKKSSLKICFFTKRNLDNVAGRWRDNMARQAHGGDDPSYQEGTVEEIVKEYPSSTTARATFKVNVYIHSIVSIHLCVAGHLRPLYNMHASGWSSHGGKEIKDLLDDLALVGITTGGKHI